MSKRVFIGIMIAMLSVVGACAQADVVPPLQLTDYLGPNTTVNIDPYTPAGVYEWLVDGTSHMTQNSYWYRIGDGSTLPISGLGSVTFAHPFDIDCLADVLYSGSVFDLQISYGLMGSDAGTGNSDLAQTLQITNNTGSSLDLHVFEYVNMDLNGTAPGETVTMDNSSISQTEGSTEGQLTLNPIIDGWELGDPTALLAKLNGASAFTLANNASYTGDAACIFEWDMSIEMNGSQQMSQDNLIQGGIVPEPASAVAFVSMLGLLPLLRRKRH